MKKIGKVWGKAQAWSYLHFENNDLLSRIVSFTATYQDSLWALMHIVIPHLPLEKSDSET